jgi:hypothetical protein
VYCEAASGCIGADVLGGADDGGSGDGTDGDDGGGGGDDGVAAEHATPDHPTVLRRQLTTPSRV